MDRHSCRREHDDIGFLLSDWLNIHVRQPNVELMIEGRQMPAAIICARPEVELPFNTRDPVKKVDVAVIGIGDIPYIQFEVQSCKLKENTSDTSREDTIRKLGYGLVDQLVYLRNHTNLNLLGSGELIQSVSGFYVPINGPLEKISCTWNDADLRFRIGRPQLVPFDSIPDEVKTARQVITSICRTEKEVRDFIFPLDVYSVFYREIGDGCFQATSGASIVIINTAEAKVYKHPFDECETTTLLQLVGKGKESPASVCFPTSSEEIKFMRFFEYPLYKSYDEVRQNGLVTFFKQVSKAVDELHSLGLCHLDIRIDNICFAADGTAVLIDLDRSVPANIPIAELRDYGNSTMYQTTLAQRNSWTAENLDWKQVAIMVYAIVNNVTLANKYHQIEIQPPSIEETGTETGLLSNDLIKDILLISKAGDQVHSQ